MEPCLVTGLPHHRTIADPAHALVPVLTTMPAAGILRNLRFACSGDIIVSILA